MAAIRNEQGPLKGKAEAGPGMNLRKSKNQLFLFWSRSLHFTGVSHIIRHYPKKRRGKTTPRQTVLTKTSDLQDRILEILGLSKEENEVLG